MSTTATGPVSYDRHRDLPRLLRLWPNQIASLTKRDQNWLVERLGQVLRAERQRGLTRHWSYDLSRHAAVLTAYKCERQILENQAKSERRLQVQLDLRNALKVSVERPAAAWSPPPQLPSNPGPPAR